ncbi:MAG: hypothetical protein ACRDN6_03100 [Gaiellaceae bacterium]
MSPLLLAGLLSLLAVAAALVFATFRTLELWRTFRAVSAALGEALERVSLAGEQTARLAAAPGEREDLGRSLGRLAVTRARFSVLLAAWSDVRASVTRVTDVYPRKS